MKGGFMAKPTERARETLPSETSLWTEMLSIPLTTRNLLLANVTSKYILHLFGVHDIVCTALTRFLKGVDNTRNMVQERQQWNTPELSKRIALLAKIQRL
jgi:hypothetical protein